MESFRWNENFETGLKKVDDQHQRLVQIINIFGEKLAKNTISDQHVECLLQDLVNYAQYHFQEEEALMAEHRLDTRHCDQHKEEHKAFLDEVTLMRQRRKPGDCEDGKILLEFLMHWLAYHILGSDQNMARQVAAVAHGLSPAEAYLTEEHNVSDSTEMLLVALNGLFQQMAKRNRELSALNQRLEAIVAERTRELVKANADLEILALTDMLTELPNRRHAMLRLHALWQEAFRLNGHLACMVVDADGFKEVNDTYGHDVGDLVLKILARELRASVRSDDIVCRLGGDEFLIICPNTPLEGALHIAQLTRKNIGALSIIAGNSAWQGSISIGVAANSSDIASVDQLLKTADDAVYIAKNAGRNCVRSRQTPLS